MKSCLTAYTNYPTLYGAGTHGYAEQWVYSCPLLFFSLFIRLWSRPVDEQRYAQFFEKTDVERRGPAYYQHHCCIFLTLGVTRAGRPLPIQETSGGDSSRNVNLDTGHNVLEPDFDFKPRPCRIQNTKFLNQNSILKKPAVPVCAVFPAGHRAL